MKLVVMAIVITAVAVTTTGCTGEPEPEPELCEPDFNYSYEPGRLWGPCRDDGTCDYYESSCEVVVNPISDTVVSHICAPLTCGEHPTCAAVFDVAPSVPCWQECDDVTDCVGGQVCEGLGCMWPTGIPSSCGWYDDSTVPGYECSGRGTDPSGMYPHDCPEGLVEGAACGDVTVVGCCDAEGHTWSCSAMGLTREICF